MKSGVAAGGSFGAACFPLLDVQRVKQAGAEACRYGCWKPIRRLWLGSGEARSAQGLEDLVELPVVAGFEFGNFASEFTVGEGETAKPNESADDFDGGLGRAFALEHVGGHQCAMFGEGVRRYTTPSATARL